MGAEPPEQSMYELLMELLETADKEGIKIAGVTIGDIPIDLEFQPPAGCIENN